MKILPLFEKFLNLLKKDKIDCTNRKIVLNQDFLSKLNWKSSRWDGETAVNPSGGLKSFGLFNNYYLLNLLVKTYDLLLKKRLCHNLGGAFSVCATTILGLGD